jgi:alpha-beta hydrolase superfamily lysophospholipase
MRPAAWDDRAMVRRRIVKPVVPAQAGTQDGLAYTLWAPDDPPQGGIVILHGAGSSKESHYDYARKALPLGLAVLAFDQRGHGESGGALDQRAVEDVVTMAVRLREFLGPATAPLALRGSSMGGYLALVAADPCRADAVIAICPASAAGLRRGLLAGRLGFEADVPALEAFLSTHELHERVGELDMPVLLLHAEGDEQVPVEHSRELAERLRHPASRLIAVPGGHHRSAQHDEELQAVSLRFIERAFAQRRAD